MSLKKSHDLAVFGGVPAVRGQIQPKSTIGALSLKVGNVLDFMSQGLLPTSGYLAGRPRGGQFVQRFEDIMASAHGVKYAIAVNSATSGLFACCSVVDAYPSSRRAFLSPFGMTATAAAALMANHSVQFLDVDDLYCLEPEQFVLNLPSSVILATNLFGHPAQLHRLREIADQSHSVLIVDGAQSIWAEEDERNANTIGHMNVLSFNVHKHLNLGEGGMILTDDDGYARRLQDFINHGENRLNGRVGLNLRMTELTAAIGLEQLERSKLIASECNRKVVQIAGAIASQITADHHQILKLPSVRPNCVSSWYCMPFQVRGTPVKPFIHALQAEGVPVTQYAPLINTIPPFRECLQDCPRAFDLWENLLILEMVGFNPNDEQIHQIGTAFKKVLSCVVPDSMKPISSGNEPL